MKKNDYNNVQKSIAMPIVLKASKKIAFTIELDNPIVRIFFGTQDCLCEA